MDRSSKIFFTLLCLQLLGCSLFEAKETTYLRSAQNEATQDQVRERLGAPVGTETDQAGQAVWFYQVREQQPGNRITAPGMWCDEYALTFDQQGILRSWTHQSYFHGGEFMPTYCVPGGFGARTIQ